MKRTALQKPCLEWQGAKNDSGYGIRHDPVSQKNVRAHRLAWEEANGRPVPPDLWVLHHCDNPSCIEPTHLYAGTAKDNVADMMRRGREGYPKTGRPKTSLQTIREGKGLTRQQCAEGLRVATHTWKRWEIGYAAPTAASLLDIAAFLEVPAAQLRDITQGTDSRAGTRRTPTAPGQSALEATH